MTKMPAARKPKQEMLVIFVPEGYILDIPESDQTPRARYLREEYEKDKWQLLFQIGFEPAASSPAVSA